MKFEGLTPLVIALVILSTSSTADPIERISEANSLLSIDPFAAYEYFMKQTPTNHSAIARSLIALGEIDRAIPYFESAGDKFSVGKALFLIGNRDDAFKILSGLKSPEAHLMAAVCVEDANPLLALKHLLKARDGLRLIDDYISLKMAHMLLELGRVRMALSTLAQAIERHPGMNEKEEVREELSRIYLMMGFPILARKQLLDLLSHDYPRYRYSAALIEEEMGWCPDETFRKILRGYPKTVWAVQSFEHLAQYGMEAEDFLHGGIAYSNLKNYEEAARFLSSYLTHSPDNELAHFELGVVRYKTAKYQEAYDLFSRVKGELTEDAIFYRARCKERLGETEEALSEYRQISATCSNYPKANYYAARLHEKEGNIDEAMRSYRTLRNRYPESSFADDACFRTGFLLHSLGRLIDARREFGEFTELYPQSPLLDGALYWMAKSMDENEEKQAIFAKLIEMNPLGYYTKLACDNFNVDLPEPEPEKRLFQHTPLSDQTARTIRRGRLFLKLGILPEAQRVFSEANTEHDYLLSLMYNRNGAIRKAISHAYRAGKTPLTIMYPRAYILTLEETSQNPFLMLALIREESRFDKSAVSRSGAIGLTQIMPPTGAEIAMELRCAGFQETDLFDAKTNLQFGSFYLEKMLRRFGELEYALAAYNAGPHRVQEWLSTLPQGSLDQFVENIPFSETRKYVKRVMASYWNYSRIYRKP